MHLQKRDFEIMKFISAMKFSDIEMLGRRFGGGKHFSVVRRRIRAMLEEGLLQEHAHILFSKRKLYTLRGKGWHILREVFPEESFKKPTGHIPLKDIDHDYKVQLCRLSLERQKRARNWRGESQLLARLKEEKKVVKRDFVPDGIYENQIGDKCAFELEIAKKASHRYEAKISHYLDIMERSSGSFRYCLFVAGSNYAYKKLNEYTKHYQNRIRVQSLEEVLSERV